MFILIGYVENIKIHVFISLIPVPDNDWAKTTKPGLKCRLFCRRQTIAVAGNQLEIALFHCIYLRHLHTKLLDD